ncbi:MAG: TIGR02117 family protein [Burkholderiaceae bacterium]
MRRRWVRALLACAAAPASYLLLAVALGAWPVNRGFVEASDGVAIYVRTNGVHAEIVVPTRAQGVDWSIDHPPQHVRRLDAPLPWIAFGWGDRDVYLNTPSWRDLRLRTALVALSGLGRGAMHVEYVDHPEAYAARRVRIGPAQYRRLVDYLRASFRRDDAGRPIRIAAPGYFDTDAFYEAVPVYALWFTCNEWARRGLAEAGVRTAAWAPFDTAIFWQLRAID